MTVDGQPIISVFLGNCLCIQLKLILIFIYVVKIFNNRFFKTIIYCQCAKRVSDSTSSLVYVQALDGWAVIHSVSVVTRGNHCSVSARRIHGCQTHLSSSTKKIYEQLVMVCIIFSLLLFFQIFVHFEYAFVHRL